MARCKGCGNESRVLNDVKMTVAVEVNGKSLDPIKRLTAICDDCVDDTRKYLKVGLEELSVPEPMKG